MGRGRSNWTKFCWAHQDYQDDYRERHPDKPYGYLAFKRQVLRSRWFKKHFVDQAFTMHEKHRGFENWLDLTLNKKRVASLINSPTLAWFRLASNFPLRQDQGKLPKPKKYLHLTYSEEEANTELEYRKRAQFFLILIQHFLGREEAKKLLLYYKKHGVKYRKVRTDQGQRLVGSDLAEFKMRLQGHSLFIPTYQVSPPLEYDDD